MLQSKSSQLIIVLLRVALGWLFFYAGITKVLNPEWSSAGYLGAAKTFPAFYHWLAGPGLLPITDFMNEWGLTLLGASLILGVFVRLSAPLGALMMILYYLAALDFPYPNPHSYLVDEHIIYALALLFLASIRAGRISGLDSKFTSRFG